MNRTEAFLVLGIEATKEEKAIKNAYREKLATTNPEDDPESFKRLRGAYEEACRYAREPEDAGVLVHRHHGRLPQDNALALDEYQNRSGTQVDTNIFTKHTSIHTF